MDPLTAGLFVAASFATSIFSNRQASRAESASIELQTEQARLQASEAAYERTKTFRQNMSSGLALSGMGFGSTTALASAYAEGFGNYMADISSLARSSQFATASGLASKAGSKSKAFANDLASVESAASLAMKLGLFA
jgi:hypothetical protein